MALKHIYDSADQIPEALREHYSEQPNGKYRVDVEGYQERLAELNRENKAARERAEAAEAKLAVAEDPERLVRIEAALTEARASENKMLVNTCILHALAKGRATGEGVSLLPEKLAQHVKVEMDENGRRRVKVLSLADGTTVLQGGYAELVVQATAKWSSLFQGHGGGGGGAPTKGGHVPAGGNTISRAAFEALSGTQRAGKIAMGVSIVD